MPKGKVRVDRIEITDPQHEDEYRYIEIDCDGDLYLMDGTGEDRAAILIRKHMVPIIVKGLRLGVQHG
jgi:hypothetical protein